MINIKEIRIGNGFIGFDDKPFAFSITDFKNVNDGILLEEIIKNPIPLTNEWLKLFGADMSGDPSFMLESPDRTLFLIINSKGYCFPNLLVTSEFSSFGNQCIALNFIQYVHELQNLYFVLTGKDLECVVK